MSAIYKRIYSKSSLDKSWFFEKNIIPNQNQFNDYIQEISEDLARKNLGFINFKIVESITLEELIPRKEELKGFRPDLYNFIFETTVEDAIDLTIITVIDLIKKYNIPIIINPFSNTYTEIFEFDNWENLITVYTELVVNDETYINNVKNDLVLYDNAIIEEFYIDNVKQDYAGVLGN